MFNISILFACRSRSLLFIYFIYSYHNFTFLVLWETETVTLISAIKKRMEKDIDEVGKIARGVKGKLEAISKDVIL